MQGGGAGGRWRRARFRGKVERSGVQHGGGVVGRSRDELEVSEVEGGGAVWRPYMGSIYSTRPDR